MIINQIKTYRLLPLFKILLIQNSLHVSLIFKNNFPLKLINFFLHQLFLKIFHYHEMTGQTLVYLKKF